MATKLSSSCVGVSPYSNFCSAVRSTQTITNSLFKMPSSHQLSRILHHYPELWPPRPSVFACFWWKRERCPAGAKLSSQAQPGGTCKWKNARKTGRRNGWAASVFDLLTCALSVLHVNERGYETWEMSVLVYSPHFTTQRLWASLHLIIVWKNLNVWLFFCNN